VNRVCADRIQSRPVRAMDSGVAPPWIISGTTARPARMFGRAIQETRTIIRAIQ